MVDNEMMQKKSDAVADEGGPANEDPADTLPAVNSGGAASEGGDGADEDDSAQADSQSIPPEIMEKIPEPMRAQVRETLGVFTSAGPMANPIAKKVTEEHISRIIEVQEEENKREYSHLREGRRYNLAYAILAIVVFFGIALMFANSNPDLFVTLISHFAAIIAGFGAGWGFTKARSDD